MTTKQTYEKNELEAKVNEIKNYILLTLESLETKKREKAKLEEEIRILKMDIEDLRRGNFDKIDERRNKSAVAKSISKFPGISIIEVDFPQVTLIQPAYWFEATAGTYQVGNRNFYFQSF
jgi:hypothetical protein